MIGIPGYSIVRTLGRGGMAVVYLAVQQSLGREVALKVLAPALAQDVVGRERFLREARIAAQLHHPHIVAIHDVGEHDGTAYMAIAYEPGGTVAAIPREKLTVDRVLSIASDVAEALEYAHARGVVHRDIKPENILVRDDGSCVLSDFGIARATGSAQPLTREGTSLGTPHYMSPEQLRGDAIDGRADLYSLGVVIYQLLTGAPPYTGEDGWAIGMQHLVAPVPQLPAEYARLQPLLEALLAKQPAERLQSGAVAVEWINELRRGSTRVPVKTAEAGVAPEPEPSAPRGIARVLAVAGALALVLLAALAWWRFHAPTAPAGKPAVAVLPFLDLSPAKDQEYFSDGIAEELIVQLARIPELEVAGRAASFALKGTREEPAAIGARLHVGTILTGSVRTAGERVRITAQLVEASSGHVVWSDSYDRQLADIFAVQDDIGGKVVAALKLKLLPPAPPPVAAPVAVATAPPPVPAHTAPTPPDMAHGQGAPSPEPVSVGAAPPAVDYKRSYAEGLKAAAADAWPEVEARMLEALRIEPAPVPRLQLYGMRFEPYVPKLFVGIAAYKRGDCATALANLGDEPTRSAMTQGSELALGAYVQSAYRAMYDCRKRASP